MLEIMRCDHTVHACVKNARLDSNNSHNRAAAKERGRSCPATTPPTLSRQSSPHKSPATEDKPKEKPLSPQSQMHSTLLGRMEEAEAAETLGDGDELRRVPFVGEKGRRCSPPASS